MRPRVHSIRLPLRILPEADESLVGFLVRLADRNCIEHPHWLARTVGISFATIDVAATNAFDLGCLSAASGIAVPALKRMAYWPSGGSRKISFLGHAIGRDMVSLQHRRMCPQCIMLSPYHRAAWDLSVITVCPIHAVRLVDRCPDCGRRLNWSCASITRCRCGADLIAAAAEPVPRNQLRGVQHVHRVLGLPMGPSAGVSKPGGPLRDLGADEMLSLLLHLGWFSTGARARPRPIKLSATSQDLHLWLSVGYDATVTWPHSFYAYLDALRDGAMKRPGRYGLAKQFGAFMDWVVDPTVSERTRLLLRAGLDTYLGQHAFLVSRSRKITAPARRTAATGSVLTLRQAAGLLGRSIVRVRDVLERHGMVVAQDGFGRGAPILVDAVAVAALRRDLDDLVDRDRAWRTLGCSRSIAIALLDGGLIARVRGAAAELFGRPAWRTSELEAVLLRLELLAGRAGPPVTAITLSRALGILRSRGVNMIEALWATADDRLGPMALDAKAVGLSRILVDPAVFLAFGSPQRQPSTLSIPETAKALNLKQQVVYHLCSAKIIATIAQPGRPGRRVRAADINRFQATYVVPSQLGLDSGRHRGWAAARLIERGAVPVSGTKVDGGRQYIFLRADVERLGFGLGTLSVQRHAAKAGSGQKAAIVPSQLSGR